MALKADFIRDVAARCTGVLTAAGYTFPAADDRGVIRVYESVKHRRIPTRPRKVHKAQYTVPSHLVEGERQLLLKVEAGGDLWPHQSRKIVDVAVEDGMLNDYGIQHFHLGTTPDPRRPQLIEGTKELLFAVVKHDDFYALGIFDHKAWSKQVLLEIVQKNWPLLIAPYTIKGALGLSRNHTEEEAADLRKNNINLAHQRPDGTIHLGMGGLISTIGTSVAASRNADRLVICVQNLQNFIMRDFDQRKLSVANLPSDILVRLEWRAEKVFAVTVPAWLEREVSEHLVIPPL
jgi:hypothetical protein